MSSSVRPPKAASNKRCSLVENRTEAAGRRKTNQSRCQIGPSRVLASGQQSEARQEFPAMAYLPNRHSVDELLQQKPPVLPDKRSEHCCSCIHGLQIGSLRAQDKMTDWKALYGLRSGEKIELIEIGMKKHVATFSTVTEEAIQLREGSNDIGIRKESVARVTCSKRAIGSATLRSSESSARAQAWESGRQHRDVPIRMVRSTYVV